jgi:hypothetical protein
VNVLVTGSSGLIGSALEPFLAAAGHRVIRLVRSRPSSGEAQRFWAPEAGILDPGALEGLDAVVNLAGENVAGRWTERKKARILNSRVKSARLLSESLAGLAQPPKVLVSASASGFYGDRADEVLTEESASGSQFLAQVCRQWEAGTEPAARAGLRVVVLRIGLVLSASGGALAQMLPPFKLGLGGRIGSGRQYWSWIALDDLLGVVLHVLNTEALRGPVNAVAPNPVTNLEFTKTLGRVLKRPTVLALPALAARLAWGQMAEELLLASTRMEPARLLAFNYKFRYPELEPALRHLLGKGAPS